MQICMDQVKNITGRSQVTHQQMQDIRNEILKIIEEKSIIQKCLGLLNFINIVWLFSILGLAISVGPCLYFLFLPLIRFFKKIFIFMGKLITVLVKFLIKNILLPLLTFSHEWGIIEFCLYLFTF